MKVIKLMILVLLFGLLGCAFDKKKEVQIHKEKKAPENEKVIKVVMQPPS